MASIFSKIIAGDIPAYKIHEDQHSLSFLTAGPIRLGHTLVVPKIEVDYFLDVPEPFYSAVFLHAKAIGHALEKATGCQRVGAMIQGLEVPHFHLHLVPMEGPSDLDFSKARERPDSEMSRIHQQILAALKPEVS